MLNLKNGRSIAIIKTPRTSNKIVYVNDQSDEMEDYNYSNSSNIIQFKKSDHRHIQQLPSSKGREVMYVAGKSGSGKSHYCAEYMKLFKKLYPKSKMYIFSCLTEDKVLDKLHPKRIILDDDLIDNPIDLDDFKNGDLILFDDVDTISNRKLKKAVMDVKDSILEMGRHKDLYILVTSHRINKGNESKTILNEAHMFTFFPRSGQKYQIKYQSFFSPLRYFRTSRRIG